MVAIGLLIVNDVHNWRNLMTFRTSFAAIIACSFATASFAGPSSQHSAQSVNHSGQAASHGSAAVSQGVATVVAVPIIAFGGAVAISGAALADVGEGALVLGSDLSNAGAGQPVPIRHVTPNGAPKLD